MDDVSILNEGTIKKNENKKESIDINDHHHRIKKTFIGCTHHQSKKGLVRWEEKSFLKNNEQHHRPFSSIRHGNKFHQRLGNQTLNLFFVAFFYKNNYPKHSSRRRGCTYYNNNMQRPGYTKAPTRKIYIYILPPRNFYLTHLSLFFFSLLWWLFVCLLFSHHFLHGFLRSSFIIRHSTNV